MHGSVVGTIQANNLVVAAGQVETVRPVLTASCFKTLGITCMPVGEGASTHSWKVTVLFNGESQEEHTYPDGTDWIARMTYPDYVFPPTQNVENIPSFAQARFTAYLLDVRVQIENLGASERSFLVFSSFEDFQNMQFNKLNFDL
jgi:hypothetical protein